MSDPFSRWANKLAHDKLAMDAVSTDDAAKLVEVVALLAERFPDPTSKGNHYSHVNRQTDRTRICTAALDLGIDLLTIKSTSRYKRGKPLIGRGLLDVWAATLMARFGSAVRTNAWFEIRRRDIKTRMAADGISLSAFYKTLTAD